MTILDKLSRKLQKAWQAAAQADAETRRSDDRDVMEILLGDESDSTDFDRSERAFAKYTELLRQWDEAQGDSDCPRCNGTGTVNGYEHVQGGKCFRCGGNGEDPHHTYQEPPTSAFPAKTLDSLHA